MNISQDVMNEPILQMGSDKMTQRYVFHKPFMVSLLDRDEWHRGMVPLREGGLVWYTDGSMTSEGNGARAYGHSMRQRYRFSLGQYAMVFEAKVYTERGYHNRNIYIPSDSQNVIKALDTYKIHSKLVWDCHQSHDN
jgi:hypothetical protein